MNGWVPFSGSSYRSAVWGFEIYPDQAVYGKLHSDDRLDVLADWVEQLRYDLVGPEPMVGGSRAVLEWPAEVGLDDGELDVGRIKLVGTGVDRRRDAEDELAATDATDTVSGGVVAGDPVNVKYVWVDGELRCVQCSQLYFAPQIVDGVRTPLEAKPYVLTSEEFPDVTATAFVVVYTPVP